MQTLRRRTAWYVRLQCALAVMLLAGLVVFALAVYLPATRRLATMNLQMRSAQQQLAQNQHRARNLTLLALEVQQLETRVQTFDRQFPKQPELGQFIRDLTQISQQLSLQEWKYQPGAPRKGEAFYELPIKMSFRGTFPNVDSFLRQVEDMQRLTRVRRLNMKSRDSTAGVVDVDMTMSIYFSES